ncbi:hypothetical protein [Nocardioides mangrovicus]|uniref:hypothetical protein n=1 Tax=Nocardioides mangrovicus TaxID=2478913 RepID=UPI0011C380C6|nr:hypothetical protein [Nocardioides mangrovicus]
MANTTMPTPVLVAGGALCLLGGYLVGVVAGPDTPQRTTAVVSSFTAAGDRLCLKGEAVKDADGAEDGVLCGTWRRSAASSSTPVKGQEFRFVLVRGQDSDRKPATLIYGDVVR